jgi:hypothetical protein
MGQFMKLSSASTVAFIAAAAAAWGAEIQAGKSGEYSGVYSEGVEFSIFLPAEVSERWWLNGKLACPDLSALPVPSANGFYPAFFIVVKGAPSQKGHYGHLGMYDREFTVEKTVSCRRLSGKELKLFVESPLSQP